MFPKKQFGETSPQSVWPSTCPLPPEILVKIFTWLPYADLQSVSLASSHFSDIFTLLASRKTSLIIRQKLMSRLDDAMERNIVQAIGTTTIDDHLPPESTLHFSYHFTSVTPYAWMSELLEHYGNIASRYLNLTTVIFSQYVYECRCVSELLKRLPAVRNLQIVVATARRPLARILNSFTDYPYKVPQEKINQLQHLTLYSKAINDYNDRNHELTTVFSNLIELNIAGFTGVQMDDFLWRDLQRACPRLHKLGLRQQHLETVLEQLQLVEPVVAARITHLTIKTFTDENPLLTEEVMNQLADKFGALEVINGEVVTRPV